MHLLADHHKLGGCTISCFVQYFRTPEVDLISQLLIELKELKTKIAKINISAIEMSL